MFKQCATLPDRIQWILQEQNISARELSRRARLPSETHIGLIIRTGGANVATLMAIAEAAAVDFQWLASGEGDPQVRNPEACDRSRPELDAFLAARPDADPAIVALLRAEAYELRDFDLTASYFRETYERFERARDDSRRLVRAGAYAQQED